MEEPIKGFPLMIGKKTIYYSTLYLKKEFFTAPNALGKDIMTRYAEWLIKKNKRSCLGSLILTTKMKEGCRKRWVVSTMKWMTRYKTRKEATMEQIEPI